MLIGVKAAELLEFVINLAGHDQVVVLVCRPVTSLHALDGEIESLLPSGRLLVRRELLGHLPHLGVYPISTTSCIHLCFPHTQHSMQAVRTV